MSENLLAAGTYHATVKGPNLDHNNVLTERWRRMAVTVGNDSLLSLLSSGTLVSNEISYHHECYVRMRKKCDKMMAETVQSQNEQKWIKAKSFEYVITYVIEEEQKQPGSAFVVQELNQMYVDVLRGHGIIEELQTTRFTQKLMESLPDLRTNIAKDRRTVVVFDDQVRRLVNEYVETPDEFYASLRKIVSPIRKEIFDIKNKFDGHFDPKCQLNSVPKRLLLMISALIDGSSETSGCNFSQETLTTAQLIMSHTRKFEKKHMPEKLIRRRHSKNQETPIMMMT